MKKLLLTLVAVLVLVGCGAKGGNTQTLSCDVEEEGFGGKTEFVFKNEKLESASIQSVVSYEDMGITADDVTDEEKEQAQALMNLMFASLGKVKLDYTSTGMEVDVAIDMKNLASMPGLEGTDIKTVTVDNLKTELESTGAVCTVK